MKVAELLNQLNKLDPNQEINLRTVKSNSLTVAFMLSMPSNNSWNGKWSGDGECYAKVFTYRGKKKIEKIKQLLYTRSWYYNFGDGWRARVDMREVDSVEGRRLKKASKGFCGYEWMIASILTKGVIDGN